MRETHENLVPTKEKERDPKPAPTAEDPDTDVSTTNRRPGGRTRVFERRHSGVTLRSAHGAASPAGRMRLAGVTNWVGESDSVGGATRLRQYSAACATASADISELMRVPTYLDTPIVSAAIPKKSSCRSCKRSR